MRGDCRANEVLIDARPEMLVKNEEGKVRADEGRLQGE